MLQSTPANRGASNQLALPDPIRPHERRVLSESELAQRWGVSAKTLQRWRSEGRGPHYLKLSKRVAAAGDRVQDYIDVDYSVSESRFNNWPPALKEQFAAARTVKPGKPSYRLALQSPEGGI